MQTKLANPQCDAAISGTGRRLTAQRREVFQALVAKRDHPTAIDVFKRVQRRLPSISLATVYNCLETLTECGLVRHVNHDRSPSRYCPNLEPHAHFFCERCGTVIDVPMNGVENLRDVWQLPRDIKITKSETSFSGICCECNARKTSKKTK